MFRIFLLGMLLGLGAAIPIGPINLEIIRRNLNFGTRYGLALGGGATLADFTYLVILSMGAMTILMYAHWLKVVGIAGSLVLAWFGFSSLRSHLYSPKKTLGNLKSSAPLWRHLLEGYVLTLLNPMTILFWSSISTQIAALTHQRIDLTLLAGFGVLCGTYSWVTILNTILHYTKHKISHRMMHLMNIIGGVILLMFAALGLWRALSGGYS